MTSKEILIAYKAGRLSTREARKKLHVVREQLKSIEEKKTKTDITQAAEIPLSYSQERLWFLAQLGNNEQYNISRAVKIKGRLDEDALQKAMTFIAGRHESLRTGFKPLNGAAIQVMEETADLQVEKRDLSGLSKEERKRESHAIIQNVSRRPFELEQAPLMRVVLIRLDSNTHIFVMCMHHIISDGWSMGILTREIGQAYEAYTRGKEPDLKGLKLQYADYAVWQRQVFTEERLEKELSAWKAHLSGYEDLDLPTDYVRPKQKSGQGGRANFRLESEKTQALKQLCQAKQVTLFTVFMAGVYILLRRYSGQEDICLGMPVANRSRREIEDLVGFFVNTLVLRIGSEGARDLTVEDLLREIREEIVDAQDRQTVPFEKVVERLQPSRDLSRNPIFQVLVNYVNTKRETLRFGDSHLEAVDLDYGRSQFDLTFDFYDAEDGGVGINLIYSRDLYRKETIERMGGHLVRLMDRVVSEPGQAVDGIEFLSREERARILDEWNETGSDYPKDKCIHELFEEQVRKTPNKVAVVFEEKGLTYKELNEKSTKLAVHLQRHGVKPDSLVGICVERSLEMIVGILGILKAGGAYAPLDPDYPEARNQYMLEDSKVKLVLTQEQLTEKVSGFLWDKGSKVIAMDTQRAEIETEKGALERKVHSNHLAYVIYTSGSTGKPKGTLIEHKNVLRICKYSNYIQIVPTDVVLQLSNFAFDGSIFDIFGALLNGATLLLIKKENALQINQLSQLIKENKVTVSFITTALFNSLVDHSLSSLQGLRKILFGGEKVSISYVNRALNDLGKDKLIHVYGPTETTVYATYYPINKEYYNHDVPIGKVITDTQVYILDQALNPQPVGVHGELHIAGDGLSREYLNQPELTREKFIDNPFNPGTRMYKTGDLAKWLPDGNIEFLGRIDTQVKVRGFRIECGEIESVLAEHPNAREAVVIARTANHSTQLIAYYVASDQDKALASGEIRSYLQSILPDYMIPAAFVSLEAIPLTPNGKIDRKALQQREIALESSEEYVAPQTETEQELARIWEEVLGVERVGIYDNFFELGGHSLLAIKMVAKIRERLGIECPVKNIFDHATVSDLSRLFPALAGTPRDNMTEFNIPKKNIKRNISIPLSNGQSLFWMAWLVHKDTVNVFRIYDVRGLIDRHHLEQAFNVLLQRHESVWARFSSWRPVQKIISSKHIPLTFIDLRDRDSGAREEGLEAAMRDALEPAFDLTSPPLLRLCLIQHEEHQHKLLLVAPHIVADDVAFHTLFDELIVLYKALAPGEPLPPKRTDVQLSDYVYWEQDETKQVLHQEVDYWRQRLERASLLHVPDSYLLRPDESARSHQVKLDSTLLDSLSKISQEHGVSFLMSLSALMAITLHRISSQSDICITTVFENRAYQELEHLVAPMATPVPIRIQLSGAISFPDLIAQTKQTTLEAYDHVRSSCFIPMWFLHRRDSDRVVVKGKELAIRFFTWLLSRLMFATQAYATLFYGLLYASATKTPRKNGQRGKMRDSRNETSSARDGMEVMLNVLPGFYQTFSPSTDRYSDLGFIPGTPPDSKEKILSEHANFLLFTLMKDPEGHPLLKAKGMRFTPSALQQIAASFHEVLAAVVKNPDGTIQEMTKQN